MMFGAGHVIILKGVEIKMTVIVAAAIRGD